MNFANMDNPIIQFILSIFTNNLELNIHIPFGAVEVCRRRCNDVRGEEYVSDEIDGGRMIRARAIPTAGSRYWEEGGRRVS